MSDEMTAMESETTPQVVPRPPGPRAKRIGGRQTLALDVLSPSRLNPRQDFAPAALAELTESIRQHGILQPIIVRPLQEGGPGWYEIVAGARRARAALAAGLTEVPVIVRDLDDVEAREVAAVENLQRADLSPIEEADGYNELVRAGHDVARIAARVGRSPAYVYDRLKLMGLVDDARELLRSGAITTGHAIILARLKPADQEEALQRDEHLGGLWSNERLLYNPSQDEDDLGVTPGGTATDRFGEALKPVSVRELQAWVDAHVRLPAEEADPMLFPDLVATTAAAVESNEKVVRITHEQITPEAAKDGPKLILGRSWQRADGKHKSKTCDHSVIGTIEIGPGRGEVLRVCVDKKHCEVHWGAEIKARKKREKEVAHSATKGEDREALRRKKEQEAEALRLQELERWRRATPAILEALAAAVKKAPATSSGPLAHSLTQIIQDGMWGDPDTAAQAEKLVPKGKTLESLVRHLVMRSLVRDVEDLGSDQLAAEAKAFGVDVKKIVAGVAVAKCGKCGCTELTPCPGGCGWASEPDRKTGLGLCTACAAGKSKPKASGSAQKAAGCRGKKRG